MKTSIFCFTLFLSRVLSDRPRNVHAAEHHQCIVNVSESSRKLFNESLENKKKVVFFRIHYDSKKADALTKSKPNDHFADPNEYMWLYDGDNGLPIYMNTLYAFEVHSLFILKEYTSSLTVNMNVSASCNESIVSRVQFLRLVFRQLIQIVSPAQLPDKRATAYVCYYINNRKNILESTFRLYKYLGINRHVLLRYCCEVKDCHKDYDNSTDLCRGKAISVANSHNLQMMAGLFLFLFCPLAIGFISRAKLPHHQEPFSLVHPVTTRFENSKEYQPPFGTESSWLHERDSYYSFPLFISWLLLYEKRSAFVSRIRRSMAVITSLIIIFADVLLQYLSIEERLKSYLDNDIPLGFIAMMFGYKKSAENTGYFFGGPLVWFPAFVILGLIVINIPDRLCQTIADSIIHQKETCTFLAQDIKLLQNQGNLNVSNLHDYDLLRAILISSLSTALNPSFWRAVINRWISRCRSLHYSFNNSRFIYQLMGICVIFACAFISCFLCVCELLLCVIYYGCPMLQILKAIPHSYTQCYICPLFRHPSFRRKILGVIGFILSLLMYLFLFIFTIYIYIMTFEHISFYTIYTVIALIAKPDAIGFVCLFLVFIYYLVSVADSISESYLSLQKLSITLAPKVCKDFVYIALEGCYIYRELFERIVQQHHPIRNEIAKALIKLAVAVYILASCAYAFKSIPSNMTANIKIAILIFTSIIPMYLSILKDKVLESRWKPLPILETIYVFQEEINFPQNLETTIDV